MAVLVGGIVAVGRGVRVGVLDGVLEAVAVGVRDGVEVCVGVLVKITSRQTGLEIIIAEWVTRMVILVVDLHMLNALELLHGCREGLNDVVGCAAWPAVADQVDIQQAVRELDPSITQETVPHGRKAVGLLLPRSVP